MHENQILCFLSYIDNCPDFSYRMMRYLSSFMVLGKIKEVTILFEVIPYHIIG